MIRHSQLRFNNMIRHSQLRFYNMGIHSQLIFYDEIDDYYLLEDIKQELSNSDFEIKEINNGYSFTKRYYVGNELHFISKFYLKYKITGEKLKEIVSEFEQFILDKQLPIKQEKIERNKIKI